MEFVSEVKRPTLSQHEPRCLQTNIAWAVLLSALLWASMVAIK